MFKTAAQHGATDTVFLAYQPFTLRVMGGWDLAGHPRTGVGSRRFPGAGRDGRRSGNEKRHSSVPSNVK